jgi:orotate phosphoribosyltransferase
MAINLIEIPRKHRNFPLRVAMGHFATSHSHSNYYIDFTMSKHRLSEARAGAQLLCNQIPSSQIIDTILCLDGTEVMGACMASELTRAGYMNMNAHRTIYVVTPEYTSGSQIIFRDNIAPMIVGKHVLVLAASVSTGYTAKSAIEAIRYYSGIPVGVCSIFACAEECEGFPVQSIYTKNDIPDYEIHTARNCPMCKVGIKIDGLVNSHGISSF